MPICPGCERKVPYQQLDTHQRYCDGIWSEDTLKGRSREQLAGRLDSVEDQLDDRIKRVEEELDRRVSRIEEMNDRLLRSASSE